MAGKLKPLEVARQITPGKYPDGDGLIVRRIRSRPVEDRILAS
jgi:hypothetical protein